MHSVERKEEAKPAGYVHGAVDTRTEHNAAQQFGTKECPVCHAVCFEDIPVCYGCLYSFENNSVSPEQDGKETAESNGAAQPALANQAVQEASRKSELPERSQEVSTNVKEAACNVDVWRGGVSVPVTVSGVPSTAKGNDGLQIVVTIQFVGNPV